MFHWAALHPLPVRLRELLDRSHAQEMRWEERSSGVVVLFLPPHSLIDMGCFSYKELLSIYACLRQELADTIAETCLLNGERLLSYSEEDLSAWSADLPLPGPAILQPITALTAHIAKAVLDGSPNLEASYHWLDQHSLLAGSEPERNYRARLESNDPDLLVEAWNLMCARHLHDQKIDDLQQQLVALEDEFEQYVLSSRRMAAGQRQELQERSMKLKRLHKLYKSQQLQQIGIAQRLMLLQARIV